ASASWHRRRAARPPGADCAADCATGRAGAYFLPAVPVALPIGRRPGRPALPPPPCPRGAHLHSSRRASHVTALPSGVGRVARRRVPAGGGARRAGAVAWRRPSAGSTPMRLARRLARTAHVALTGLALAALAGRGAAAQGTPAPVDRAEHHEFVLADFRTES